MPLSPRIRHAEAVERPAGATVATAAATLIALGPAFVRFIAVGGAGLALDAALFALLSHAGLSDALARALSLGAATLLTWRLNRRFTFAESGRRHREELARYALVALTAQGLNYAVFLLLRGAVPVLPALVALLSGAGFAALFSFTGQRLFTFAPAPAPAGA
ncbi:MAG TPA: GtrA family protein [Hyphomicrobiales bacterium]|nr:GtrA family protein [Hyphomicrobiales bacterium]